MLIASLIFASLTLAAPSQPPPTPKQTVTDSYHGEEIVDDYRWLENWDDPKTQAWSEAQNRYARDALDRLPSREAIEKRVTRLLSDESPSYSEVDARHGRLYAMKHQPPKEQSFLVVCDSLDDLSNERTLVDPNVIDPSGGLAIDWYVPSLDGSVVAVSMSRNGTESGELHLFDVATGHERAGDRVPRVNSGTAGGSLAWSADGRGFWYTRHPVPGSVPDGDLGFLQQVYYHKLGADPASDSYSLGRDFPRIAESALESSEDGGRLLDLVGNGDGGEFDLYLLDRIGGGWKRIAGYEDRVTRARFGPDGSLWLLSRKDAGLGKILLLGPGETDLAGARTIVPEGRASIESFEVTRKSLWVVEEIGGPSRLHRYDSTGVDLGPAHILPISSVGGIARIGDDEVIFQNESYIEPPAWYRIGSTGLAVKTVLAQTSPVPLSFIDVRRVMAISKDGTKVPMTVIEAHQTSNEGNNPTLLTGYGGFYISLTPTYSRELPIWIEQGGVLAIANLRGGGEYGEAWHQAGTRIRKQNVFDDFFACAETLISQKYTSPARLAIEGGSNGGLLMGVAMTQRPDLFRTVVAQVGYYDMLRFETRPNGAFNSTEYGSVSNPEEYRALKGYSPYQRVYDGVKYPPALFLTGANDPRVDPMHSRKMVARLQATGATAYLRTSGSTGHGIGTPLSEEISEAVDIYTFLFNELGVSYTPVAD